MQREMAQRRMMQEVPKADVVVTNPTHYAVALRYDPEKMHAPIVVALGKDLIAANIRESRPPEPYKGKGIRYRGEHVARKVGKRV